jgi:hypothetical protein
MLQRIVCEDSLRRHRRKRRLTDHQLQTPTLIRGQRLKTEAKPLDSSSGDKSLVGEPSPSARVRSSSSREASGDERDDESTLASERIVGSVRTLSSPSHLRASTRWRTLVPSSLRSELRGRAGTGSRGHRRDRIRWDRPRDGRQDVAE